MVKGMGIGIRDHLKSRQQFLQRPKKNANLDSGERVFGCKELLILLFQVVLFDNRRLEQICHRLDSICCSTIFAGAKDALWFWLIHREEFSIFPA